MGQTTATVIERFLRCGFAPWLLPLGSAWVGCGHSTPPVAPTESPSLEQEADGQAHASAPDGERVGAALHGVAFEHNGVTDWSVPLEAGRCYWFGFAADASVTRFGVYIWDPANHRVETDRGRPRVGVVNYCPTMNGMHRIEGKVMVGSGHFAVVTYAKGAAAPPPASPEIDLAAIIEQQAASAAPGATRVGDYFAGSAETSDWVTQMDSGKCYWIIGAGEPGKVKKLYLYLWDPQSKRITESRSDSDTAMVGYCAKEPGMYKFQAKVSTGRGLYKVGVYAK